MGRGCGVRRQFGGGLSPQALEALGLIRSPTAPDIALWTVVLAVETEGTPWPTPEVPRWRWTQTSSLGPRSQNRISGDLSDFLVEQREENPKTPRRRLDHGPSTAPPVGSQTSPYLNPVHYPLTPSAPSGFTRCHLTHEPHRRIQTRKEIDTVCVK